MLINNNQDSGITMRSLLLFFFFFVTLGKPCFSQDESFINYTTKDGLPSSQVYDIIQDDYGYLWFSTDKGLSRYDGYEFQNFNKSHGLTDNVVFDLVKRSNGQIWGATNASTLFYFEGANPTFTPYKYNDLIKNYGSNKIIHSHYLSDNGDVFIGYHNHLGYLKISKSGKVQSDSILYARGGVRKSLLMSVHCLIDDENDPFYFIGDTIESEKIKPLKGFNTVSSNSFKPMATLRCEAMYFDNKKTGVFVFNNIIHIEKPNQEHIIDDSKNIIASGKLNDHQFWVGSLYGGVSVYDLSGNKINEFLPDRSVTQLFVDHEGHTWISTLERGVFMIRNNSMNFLSDLGAHHITSLSKGPNNDLYFGAYDGDIYHRTEGGKTRIFSSSVSNAQPAYIVYDEARKQIYFSNEHIFNLEQNFLENVHVNFISLVGDKHIFMGNFGAIYFNIDSKKIEKLFSSVRTRDVILFNGKVFAGSISGLYQSGIGASENDQKQVIDSMRIDDLEIFGDYLVLGTNGDGLVIVDKSFKPIFRINQSSGLTSNYVTKSHAENDSTLWVCTNRGINRIIFSSKTASYKIEKLDFSDGLVSNEVWDLVIHDDTVWIGTQGGVNYISEKDFSNLNMKSNSYFLQWKSMKVNDASFEGVHSFKYYQNKLEFRLLGISFAEESDLVYQYKLVGLDKNWSSTKNRVITFSSLPPGSYELLVKIKGDKAGSGMNEIRYAFTIHSPFWKTWWFISICILGVGAIVFLFFKIRVLTYNKDVVREIMRYILQKLRRDEPTILLRENGKDVKVKTGEIHYIKTSGNYLEVHLKDRPHLIRSSISKFMESLPDNIEFIQVHRSYIVRIDKVQQKGKDELIVLDTPIPIGRTYVEKLKLIKL